MHEQHHSTESHIFGLRTALQNQYGLQPGFIELVAHHEPGGVPMSFSEENESDSLLSSIAKNIMKGVRPARGATFVLEILTHRSAEGKSLAAQIYSSAKTDAASFGLQNSSGFKLQEIQNFSGTHSGPAYSVIMYFAAQ